MSKNKPLKICNETIHPGETLSLALPLPQIFSCAPLHMPLKIHHGKQDGPCMLVFAAMHGNELNGTEIISRIDHSNLLKRLQGTLIMVPVINVYGLVTRSRFLPGGIDLDRCFPGSAQGNNASRMAHLFTSEIFSLADYCIDLQTGPLNSRNLPQVFASFKDERSKNLATFFNAPVISDMSCEKGMLRTYALSHDIPYLLYEAGEALRFDEHAIKTGVNGIINIMRELEMLPANSKKEKGSSHIAEKNTWVRASTSGISHTQCKLGQYLKKGEILCTIKDPFDATEPVNIKSPRDAIIVGINNLPLVHEGEDLFQLAVFPKMQQTATDLKNWKTE